MRKRINALLRALFIWCAGCHKADVKPSPSASTTIQVQYTWNVKGTAKYYRQWDAEQIPNQPDQAHADTTQGGTTISQTFSGTAGSAMQTTFTCTGNMHNWAYPSTVDSIECKISVNGKVVANTGYIGMQAYYYAIAQYTYTW